MILGVHVHIWIVIAIYFFGMLAIGWWSRVRARNSEGYLLGNRKFGVFMMIMHAFGAGTNPGDAAGVISRTVSNGVSGIWVSWLWLFGTPFYWLIAPVIRRMRCLTMADFYEERFGKVASVLYIFVASTGMIICLASVLLATSRTVQGLIGKAADPNETWFFIILFITSFTFMLYGYWGGIVAAIRADMIHGTMIIILSFIAIPPMFQLDGVGGLEGIRITLGLASAEGSQYLHLFDPSSFNVLTIILLCINAPLSSLAFPHLITVCAAGKTEWEGRVGFSYGALVKRFCTIGWCLLGLAWLTYLINSGAAINDETVDTAFGDSIRMIFSPALQGVMLACLMAAAMSSGDAFQVTIAGLLSQNIYKKYINPNADDKKVLLVTKFAGIGVVLSAIAIVILMRHSVVTTILDYFNILGLVGISAAMGLVWRRMNGAGMLGCTLTAIVIFIVTRYGLDCSRQITLGFPILGGILGGISVSLLTAAPSREKSDSFYKKIYCPIGQEEKMDLPLDQVVPESRRLCTSVGLFIVKPTMQTFVGFWLLMAICFGCVGFIVFLF